MVSRISMILAVIGVAATVVPVVNDKCLMCHSGHKVGDMLGGKL